MLISVYVEYAIQWPIVMLCNDGVSCAVDMWLKQKLNMQGDQIRIWKEAAAVDWQADVLLHHSSAEAEESRETSNV
jgi:hypothetical protein